jgi:hypothetical protein
MKTARCGRLRARVLKAFSLLPFLVALDKWNELRGPKTAE